MFCRTKTDCGFGNSCYLERPVPKKIELRSGVCKPGLFNTWACRRDGQCVGDLVCARKPAGWRCEPISAYAGNTRIPNGFANCTRNFDCGARFVCKAGRCHASQLGAKCTIDKFPGRSPCSFLTNCLRGTCTYSSEGDPCYNENRYYTAPCSIGLVCDAPRGSKYGTPGKCVKGLEGSVCWDAHECSDGLICGTSRKCVKSAEGQRCLSDFWCPAGAVCRKSSKKCTFDVKSVPAGDRFPESVRARPCKLKPDCGQLPAGCFNGICLPPALGWACNAVSYGRVGLTCISGVFVEGVEGNPCDNKMECWEGFSCSAGFCRKSTPGATCHDNFQCPNGYGCFGYPGVCDRSDLKCVNDSGCSPGLVCRGPGRFGVCVKPNPRTSV